MCNNARDASNPKQEQAMTVGKHAASSHLRRMPWHWLASGWVTMALAESAAVLCELDSKRNASGPPPGGALGAASYDAGWPFSYTHVRYQQITFPAWQATLHAHPPLASLNWFAVAADILVLGGIFAVGLALVVGAWALAAWARGTLRRAAVLQSVLLGIVLATVWAILSIFIVNAINQQQPTDAATWAQISSPLTLLGVLPGAISFVVQRAFEATGGISIAQTAGPSAFVELVAVLALGVALPAALLSALVLGLRRAWVARFRRTTASHLQESAL
jgi:hypothetical protein